MSTREERADLTVYGFIRKSLNVSILIPVDVIKLCILFYLNQMVFYKEKHGDGLQFDDENNIVTFAKGISKNRTHHQQMYIFRVCIFDYKITGDLCDSFTMNFKWMKSNKDHRHKFIMIGYIIDAIDKSIGDWHGLLAKGKNKDKSCAILSGPDYDAFFLYKNDGYVTMDNKMKMEHNPNEEDEFKVKFDFKNDNLLVYHNEKLITSAKLNGVKGFMPALCLTYVGQKIQVTKWEFCKGDASWT